MPEGYQFNTPTRFIKGSIEGRWSEHNLDRCFEDIDAVVHAAASYSDPNAWERDIRTNVHGTIAVAQMCVEDDVRLVYLQTGLCYGLNPQEQPITTDYPLCPEGSSYAVSKTTGEQYLQLSEARYVTLRLANMYGPRNLAGPVPTFYKRLSEGQACCVADTRRDFVYVGDLIRLLLRVVDGEGEDRTAYHVSSGSDVSIGEVYMAVCEAMGQGGRDVPLRPSGPDDAPSLLLDPSRTHAAFPGWRAEFPLLAGVDRTVGWYKEHGVDKTYTHLKMGVDGG